MNATDKALLHRIRLSLATNDLAVERAITILYDRQTQDEKEISTTKHTNHRGFNQPDARRMSYFARWIRSGRHLSGHHLVKARATVGKYWRQLMEVAKEKAASAPAGHQWAQARVSAA